MKTLSANVAWSVVSDKVYTSEWFFYYHLESCNDLQLVTTCLHLLVRQSIVLEILMLRCEGFKILLFC